MHICRSWLAPLALGCLAAGAQSFDAASIKPSKAAIRGYSIQPLPGRVSAQNVTLRLLISEAYHVYDFQVSGVPKWGDTDRFDVEAKAAGDVPPSKAELRIMLRKLLEDRFSLVVRHETTEMPVYALEIGKGGSKLTPAQHPDAPEMFRIYQRRQVTAANSPLEALTETLTWLLGKPVLDKTGLRGTFDYKLEWAPDEVQVQSQEAPPQTDGSVPSLTGALQQLGLKLTPRKDAVAEIVVETVERPTSN
jgi:uncharacterized protein (TIGR03435 family)